VRWFSISCRRAFAAKGSHRLRSLKFAWACIEKNLGCQSGKDGHSLEEAADKRELEVELVFFSSSTSKYKM